MRTKLAICAAAAVLSLAGNAQADGWKLGPVFDEGWKAEPTLAANIGVMDPDHVGQGSYKGLEFSMNCPWFQPPSGVIRQQFDLGSFDHDGLHLDSFELNPHYYVALAPGWTIGAGPGIGGVKAYVDGGHTTIMSSVQLGAAVNYRNGAFFFAFGGRYQDTLNKEIAPGKYGADNWLISAKIGINF